MFRYYVSFANVGPQGFAIATADFTRPTPITNLDDVNDVRDYFIQQGYRNVTILGFSAYSREDNNRPPRRPNSGGRA